MIFHEIPQKPFVEGQKAKDNNGKIGEITTISNRKNIAYAYGLSREFYIANHGFASHVRYASIIIDQNTFSIKQLLCGKVARIIPA